MIQHIRLMDGLVEILDKYTASRARAQREKPQKPRGNDDEKRGRISTSICFLVERLTNYIREKRGGGRVISHTFFLSND